MIICDGRCGIEKSCKGKIQKVTVYGGYGKNRRSWGKYFYCEKAIQIDIKNGYEIEDVEGNILTN